MELMCIREFAEEINMSVEDVEFKTVAFLDQPLQSFLRSLPYYHSTIKIFRLISQENPCSHPHALIPRLLFQHFSLLAQKLALIES